MAEDVNPRFTWTLISNSAPFVLAHFYLLDNLGVGSRSGVDGSQMCPPGGAWLSSDASDW